MSGEERLDRIEHITAGLAEQGRNDREGNRQLWRETQRQIQDLGNRIDNLAGIVRQLAARWTDSSSNRPS
jgi:hypothetical protein